MLRRELVAFGSAIRQYRSRLALSQEALAERSELHRTYVSGIERGQRNVGLINIYKLAAALKVTPAELFATAEEFRTRRRTAGSAR
jgi:transcriptional regulator with XRE-family HTH domain